MPVGVENENSRRELIKEALKDLSNDMLSATEAQATERITHIISTLSDAYEDAEFRHYYSDISDYIFTLTEEDMDTLLSNTQMLYRSFMNYPCPSGNTDFPHLRDCIRKLYDYIETEIRRNRYMDNIKRIQKKQEETSDKLQTQTDDCIEKLDDLDNQIKGYHSNSITVLSIFAAIVITFIGGLSFTSKVIESMNGVSIYRLVFVIIGVGFVLFNSVTCLMYFVGRATDRTILRKCKSVGDCDCKTDDEAETCTAVEKVKRRLPYVYYFNKILLIALITMLLAWVIDVKYWVSCLHELFR